MFWGAGAVVLPLDWPWDVPVFAVGWGMQKHQPSLPPSVRLMYVVGAACWVSGAAAPCFEVWRCATAFPTRHPELWVRKRGEKGSLLTES